MSNLVEWDDFWIRERPLFVWFGPEFSDDLTEYVDEGVAALLGWRPQDILGFAAMCNDLEDHRILGDLALQFARRFGGVVDFHGALSPPIQGELEDLWRKQRLFSADWRVWEPYFDEMMEGVCGRLITSPYVTANGREWARHIGDPDFLEWWLRQPNFRMIK